MGTSALSEESLTESPLKNRPPVEEAVLVVVVGSGSPSKSLSGGSSAVKTRVMVRVSPASSGPMSFQVMIPAPASWASHGTSDETRASRAGS